ncbi:decapping enzyme [Niveomyces insectorum RCEF 264]|uniref:Decapping enzyme n=1 Tax=Niveomyces insectorum RCEF 264 TaxID=1081102 RepID=A0A167QX28_9HYPO|nr:decapping enzyme [Niveomyces insectorum RCEF 264]
MKFEDWLDDLCVRFIINLPEADLTSMARICFLVEEAHWFYEDFIRPLDNSLPSMTLRNFCLAIFQRCPLLAPFPIENHIRAFEEFLKYKISVPVRGAILLNETMDLALLVKGWKKGAHWSFPKGKINMDEDDLDCAIREVAEETGFDVRAAGLVPPPEDVKYIETTFRDQQLRLYVFRNVPVDTYFEPKTRKEISKIQWYRIADLPSYRKKNNNANNANNANSSNNINNHHPHHHNHNHSQSHHPGHETDDPASVPNANKFYMVAPFVGPLRKWVALQKKKDAMLAGHGHLAPQMSLTEDVLTEDETSAQPEPEQFLQRSEAPESILENASRELQRLLKVQPLSTNRSVQAPAGDVDAAAPSGFFDSNQNKANALLAVLQKGSSATQRSKADGPQGSIAPEPHTPLEHNYTYYGQAPQPHAPHPHHHHAQYPSSVSHPQQPPPPPFHLQMALAGHGENAHTQAYNQYGAPRPNPPQQLPQQLPHRQNQQYQQQQQQQQQYQQRQAQVTYQQPAEPGFNPNVFAAGAQNYPPPYALAGGGHAQGSAASGQPPPPPPVPLLHPQPLPPTVQKALFTRESLASPDGSAAVAAAAGRQINIMPPPPPPQHRGQQPPLSNHAASLLQVFKSDEGGRHTESRTSADAFGWQEQQQQQQQRRQQQPQQQPQQHQQQNLQSFGVNQGHHLHGARPQPGPQHRYPSHATASPPTAAPFTGQPLPGSGNNNYQHVPAPQSAAGPTSFNNNNNMVPRSVQQTEQQRNALLGIFKQQSSPRSTAVPGAPQPATSHYGKQGAAVLPGGGGDVGPRLSRSVYVETLSTSPAMEAAAAVTAAARTNGGPGAAHPDANSLPFGAMSLLTRPAGAEGGSGSQGPAAPLQAQSAATSQSPPYAAAAHHGGPPASSASAGASSIVDLLRREPSGTHVAGGPQSAVTGRRPQQQPQQQQHPPHQQHQQPSYTNLGYPVQAATQPPPPPPLPLLHLSGRRPDAHPEQKQKLLALFGQQPPLAPPPPASVSSQGSASIDPMAVASGTGTGKGKAREGSESGAAAANLHGSRRGSQTPISPADRSFLLGYLASVAGAQ